MSPDEKSVSVEGGGGKSGGERELKGRDNTLGTERAHSQLLVTRRRGPCAPPAGVSTVTVGIVVIAVVTSIVLTSLVWVCIIYQTRKKSEDCSVTNTDETIVPPDVPSYLSSQGTLSERQDGCIRVEAANGPQPNGHAVDSTGFDGPVMCTDCLESSEHYSKDPDYRVHGFAPSGLREYHQHVAPPPYSHCHPADRTAPLCNGTREDRDVHPCDREANRAGGSPAAYTAREDSFHPPVKLTSRGHLDGDCEPELRRTLLSNGHAVSSSPTRSAPLEESHRFAADSL
ncbi:leucine-rich repeats and immunoglobulin-like domains protein 1 [Hippocampus comes]|uniref:leucine-rich repeats and immunoglobulin-like domains protein 1 n=1 Tax=Hippocampus comes TaxID=109280 RepID=UPI00094F1266|nr:PREDICTED: leucine-rich repeats and immunoglobulin-like domains protein 1 [Hippocampus comes]